MEHSVLNILAVRTIVPSVPLLLSYTSSTESSSELASKLTLLLLVSSSLLVVEPLPLAVSAAASTVAATEVEYSVTVLFVVCDLPVRVGCGNGTCTVFCKWQQIPQVAMLAAAAAEMVVVGIGKRVWMGKRSQLLRQNDATNTLPNGGQWPIVIPAIAMVDHTAGMWDNLGVTKMATKTNVGPWQQGNNTEEYDDRGNNRPPSSLANREDNDAAMGNNQGNRTAMDNDGGNTDARTSHIMLAALKPPATTTTLTMVTPMPRCCLEEDPGE
jgi:hypothetical protein